MLIRFAGNLMLIREVIEDKERRGRNGKGTKI